MLKIIKMKDTHCIPNCQVKARSTGNFNININIAGTLISCAFQSLVVWPLGLHLEPSKNRMTPAYQVRFHSICLITFGTLLIHAPQSAKLPSSGSVPRLRSVIQDAKCTLELHVNISTAHFKLQLLLAIPCFQSVEIARSNLTSFFSS